MNIQGWFPLGLTGLVSLQSKGLSQVFSYNMIRKHHFFSTQPSLWSNSHPYMTTGKTIGLTIWIFVSKVMSLFFNTLSRFVIAFLLRSKRLFNFMAAVTVHSDLGAPENIFCQFSIFPFYLPLSDGISCHDPFFMLIFKAAFSHSSFTLIKKLFSSSSISAIWVVSSAYLRLLIFLSTSLIPTSDSSSPAMIQST